jgi:hypothetical protein
LKNRQNKASVKQKMYVIELKEGLSIEEIQQNQVSENYEKANIFNASVVSTLATKYYCPEFNNK